MGSKERFPIPKIGSSLYDLISLQPFLLYVDFLQGAQSKVTQALKTYDAEPHDIKLRREESVQNFLDSYINLGIANGVVAEKSKLVFTKCQALKKAASTSLPPVITTHAAETLGNDLEELRQALRCANENCQIAIDQLSAMQHRATHVNSPAFAELVHEFEAAVTDMVPQYSHLLSITDRLSAYSPSNTTGRRQK